jgi:putative serine protease PepD
VVVATGPAPLTAGPAPLTTGPAPLTTGPAPLTAGPAPLTAAACSVEECIAASSGATEFPTVNMTPRSL